MKLLQILSILLFTLVGSLHAAKDTVTLDGVHLTMSELVKEASKKTGLKLDLQVRESKAVRIFYDCTIKLKDLLKAVKGYYKNQAGIDLQIVKTTNGYWLGLVQEISPLPINKTKTTGTQTNLVQTQMIETKEQPVKKFTKKVHAPKNLKKFSHSTKKTLKKTGKSISKFFKGFSSGLKRKQQNKDKEKSNLHFSPIKEMNPKQSPESEISIKPESKAKKPSYNERKVIEMELTETKKSVSVKKEAKRKRKHIAPSLPVEDL